MLPYVIWMTMSLDASVCRVAFAGSSLGTVKNEAVRDLPKESFRRQGQLKGQDHE